MRTLLLLLCAGTMSAQPDACRDVAARFASVLPGDLDRAKVELSKCGGVANVEVAKAWQRLGRGFRAAGRLNDAENAYVVVTELASIIWGKDSPERGIALQNRAAVVADLGDFVRSGQLAGEALKLLENANITSGAVWADVMNTLAVSYDGQGRAEEALKSYRFAIAQMEQRASDNAAPLFHALINLASFLARRSEFDECQKLFDRARPLAGRLGAQSLVMARFLTALGQFEISTGRLEQGENNARAGSALFQQLNGENHPDTILAALVLAHGYLGQHRSDEAEPLLLKCLSSVIATMGPLSAYAALVLTDFGALYASRSQWDQAESSLLRALMIRKNQQNLADPELISIQRQLADVYAHLGRAEEANRLAERTLKTSEEALGLHNVETALAAATLGKIRRAQKRYQEALGLYGQARQTLSEAFGAQSPEVAKILIQEAGVYWAQKRPWEAETRYRQGLSILQERDDQTALRSATAEYRMILKKLR